SVRWCTRRDPEGVVDLRGGRPHDDGGDCGQGGGQPYPQRPSPRPRRYPTNRGHSSSRRSGDHLTLSCEQTNTVRRQYKQRVTGTVDTAGHPSTITVSRVATGAVDIYAAAPTF